MPPHASKGLHNMYAERKLYTLQLDASRFKTATRVSATNSASNFALAYGLAGLIRNLDAGEMIAPSASTWDMSVFLKLSTASGKILWEAKVRPKKCSNLPVTSLPCTNKDPP